MVCDGASSNLSLLKVLAEYKGTQLSLEPGVGMDRFLPKMAFANPYDPEEDNNVFMMICPSHQVHVYEGTSLILITLYISKKYFSFS